MEHDLVGCLKAMEQYKEEAASFDKYIEENKDLVPLADAIVSLRENFRDDVLSRANVCQLLYHIDSKKTLRSFKYVLDKEEHMNLPSSMESLVHEISYNIEDDGCIDLCRVKIRKKDMWACQENANTQPLSNTTFPRTSFLPTKTRGRTTRTRECWRTRRLSRMKGDSSAVSGNSSNS